MNNNEANLILNLPSTDIEKIINTIEEDEKAKLNILIENYENLVKANINNLNRLLDIEKNKSIILYNFGLIIELFLKMILLKLDFSNINEILKYNHNISEMFKVILNNSENLMLKRVCGNIKHILTLIKKANGDNINYNEYSDFRYNHKKYEINLIFEDDINETDIKHIKEVLECIELLMK